MSMTQQEAAERINLLLSHAWMVRQFLKHADEVQDQEDMLDVHRTIFDYTRAVEPSYQRQDWAEFLHRARGKLSKLRKAAEHFSQEYRRVSDHTNFAMAAASLRFVVQQIEETLALVERPGAAP
jgi:hypothetical protein